MNAKCRATRAWGSDVEIRHLGNSRALPVYPSTPCYRFFSCSPIFSRLYGLLQFLNLDTPLTPQKCCLLTLPPASLPGQTRFSLLPPFGSHSIATSLFLNVHLQVLPAASVLWLHGSLCCSAAGLFLYRPAAGLRLNLKSRATRSTL